MIITLLILALVFSLAWVAIGLIPVVDPWKGFIVVAKILLIILAIVILLQLLPGGSLHSEKLLW